MQTFIYPLIENWKAILTRPAIDNSALTEKVKAVMQAVQTNGDKALQQFTLQFDGIQLSDFQLSTNQIKEAINKVEEPLKIAIQQAATNITTFHKEQVSEVQKIETMPGVVCWRKSIGIEKVGLYIPGGSAPLFSTILMLGIPAKLAGCKEIILCSPPNKEASLHPAIVYAAQLVGITKIFMLGGVQAIAAMALGTETVPNVYKIFGPGNQYVTAAKQYVQQMGIAIDMPAGPSEVCVLADETANPAFVAADLLSQAEHGADSQVLLVTTDTTLPQKVETEINVQLEKLSRKNIATNALVNSRIAVMQNIEDAIELVNKYAAEHLIIACKNEIEIAEKIKNAGSIFLGNYSPESVGDYASGTNHTLPTNGFANAYSGVSVDSFVKKITVQQLSKQGLQNIAKTVETMAFAEGLDAHANAVSIRL
jgi:histidinol dehydrogenase